MATKLQIRRDTAANWTSANPTLSAGEFGFETDTYKLKIGDGSTAWSSLSYFGGSGSGTVDSAFVTGLPVSTFSNDNKYLDSSAAISLLGNGSVQNIIPSGNELYDLGDSNHRWRDLYLSGSTIYIGDVQVSVDSSGVLRLPEGTQVGTVRILDSADVAAIAGGLSGLDSTGVQNVINAAYIQANQITYNTSNFVDSSFVTAQINNLIDGAPGTLNTLNEIAAALNDDDSAYGTLLGLINAKTDYDSADTLALIDSAYIQARQTTSPSGVDSAAVTALIDSAYIQARQTSGGSGTVDSDQVISIINNNTNSGFYKYKYTATSGQTVFADSDANGNVMSFDPNSTLVFYNGVLLDETTDYTASSNTVTLTSGADAGVSITVAKYGVGYVAPSFVWGGDRGVAAGGYTTSPISNVLDYYDINTTSNASDFGDLSSGSYLGVGLGDTTKALFNIGYNDITYVNTIDYVTVSTTSNASDFGDMTVSKAERAGVSDGTYGLFAGGSATNVIDYVIIATPGNATDFGDMSTFTYAAAGVSNGTYGIFGGGDRGGYSNVIEYVIIATTGNTSDFGDLTVARRGHAGLSDPTRGVFAGGMNNSAVDDNTIDYITMATPGNASDFGDLTTARNRMPGIGNDTYGTFAGGHVSAASNIIDYVTIQTTANAVDFGDLTVARNGSAGASGSPS